MCVFVTHATRVKSDDHSAKAVKSLGNNKMITEPVKKCVSAELEMQPPWLMHLPESLPVRAVSPTPSEGQ